jgi:hypothetical protein
MSEEIVYGRRSAQFQDQFMKYTESTHTHLPVPDRLEIRKMLTNVKTRVDRETGAIDQIHNEELAKANLSRAALAIAPTAREASKCKLFLFRQKFDVFCRIDNALNQLRRQTTPALPTPMNFDIPSLYQKTTGDERYLLADKILRVDGEVAK